MVLYGIVREHLETFLEEARGREGEGVSAPFGPRVAGSDAEILELFVRARVRHLSPTRARIGPFRRDGPDAALRLDLEMMATT
jgi:hypothetical protein